MKYGRYDKIKLSNNKEYVIVDKVIFGDKMYLYLTNDDITQNIVVRVYNDNGIDRIKNVYNDDEIARVFTQVIANNL